MNTHVPTISLGLPVFNGERYLALALDSILAQSFEDFELVISDNASTDATPRIIDAYARRDPRVRVIRQRSNIGLARNWNAAAIEARGTYYKFVSSNDEYAPSLLRDCVEALRNDPSVVLCYGRTQFLSESGARLELYDGDFAAISDDPLERYTVARDRFSLGTALQSGVVRLDALKRCGYLGNYLHSDRVLTAGLALCGKIKLLPALHFYRRMGKDVSTRMKAPVDAQRMFEPSAKRAPTLVYMRVHAEHAMAMASAPLPVVARARGIIEVLRYAYWDKPYLMSEIGATLRGRSAA